MSHRPYLRVDRADGIAVLWLCRPPANALDLPFVQSLIDQLVELLSDANVRAIVLTGSGIVFSAGLDLKLIPSYGPEEQSKLAAVLDRLMEILYLAPIPTVAAVNGHAIAGGLIVALACDRRVGAEGATFGLTEVLAGVPFPAGALAVVLGELSPGTARTLMLGGKKYAAREAMLFGILDDVDASESVLPHALTVAKELSSLPAGAYSAIKKQLRAPAFEQVRQMEFRGKRDSKHWLLPDTAATAARVLAHRR